jgi:RHS repeat-associated protein
LVKLVLTDRRGVQAYSYDAADQLLQIESTFNPFAPADTQKLFVRSGASDANRTIFTTTYSFDAAGNEVGFTGPGNKTTKYEFDTLNRLTSVSAPGSEPVQYQYDAEGRRVAIASQGGRINERFLYSGLGRSVLADMDGKGEIKARYITLPGGQLLARVDSSSNKPAYYHFDALGSTVAVTDEKGRVVSRSTYDPYGARRSHPATDDRYGFVGNEWVKDEGNGLMQMGVRFYDTGKGRFIRNDPLYGINSYLSRYAYVRNNPMSTTDPSGLVDPLTMAVVGFALVEAAAGLYYGVNLGKKIIDQPCGTLEQYMSPSPAFNVTVEKGEQGDITLGITAPQWLTLDQPDYSL